MNQYLLDTDICVFLLKDKFGIKEKIKSTGISNCFISEITIAELTYGAYKSDDFERHIKEVSKMEQLFTVMPIYDCFSTFAKEKVRLRKEGNIIPDFDLLIGSVALNNDFILVTNNAKHFMRMNGLNLEDWVSA